jgi:hypothetical protein
MNGKTFQQKETDRLMEQYTDTEVPAWEEKAYDDIEKVMNAFSVIIRYGNVMGRKAEQTAEILNDTLAVEHRTLQQGAISALINTLITYADAPCDGRNEYSVKTCRLIKEALEQGDKLYKGKYSAPFI